jgi:predicted small secreted protein
MQKLRAVLTVAVAGAALLTACDNSTSSGAGKVAVQLTDAPFPFSEVSRADVFVVRVDAKTSSTTDAAAANAADNSGWTTLATPNASINLLALNGGQVSTLGVATLPNGTYQGFRIVIDPSKSSVTLTDGSHPNIVWPSAAQTGIKVNLTSPLVVSSDSSVFVIDFDVGASFVMRGNDIRNNGLLFKPVVRGLVQDITGSITGSVVEDAAGGPAMANATVELMKSGSTLSDNVSDDVLRTTSTDASGSYTFGYVLPGSYEIRVTPPSGSLYQAAMLDGGVTLTTGQTLTAPTVILTKP